MKETDLQNNIRIALSEYGLVLRLNVGNFVTHDGRHISSGLPPGTPDLLYIGHNCVAFIEVKTEKGKVSKKQQHFIDHIKKLGCRAGVARSVEDALKIIQCY